MEVHLAQRLEKLPPYIFAAIEKLKKEAKSKGADLIDLSIGDPDMPTPEYIVKAMQSAVANPKNHQYPSYEGMPAFKEAVANWYRRRFNVNLDPSKEVISLIGSKEGIAHTPLAFINPGETVLCPCPAYPVYSISTYFADGNVYFMPLKEENSFFPDFSSIPEAVLKNAKLMFLNYPNNPTSASCTESNFKQAIEIALKYNIIICHDAAYTEVYYDGKKPQSFLEIDGAKEVGIEYHSLSKSYNMTGWRIGFACGNKDIIAGLGKIKTNVDSGVFQAIQEAGITALNSDENALSYIRDVYQKRRDILHKGLNSIGLNVNKPEAAFYLWTKVPKSFPKSSDFIILLLNNAHVLATPGNGFGDCGEGYIRFALTVDVDRLEEAVKRIKKTL
ncbi:class I and II aminotransferase [Candidatus Magnetoovum chiemensis]|nr:class I and II aminotransferase [Candidatus Magnetoovum chiemensis]